MAVQMAALAFVVRDAVSGVEFESARDQHIGVPGVVVNSLWIIPLH